MEHRLSTKLAQLLVDVENEINQYREEQAFFIDVRRKDYATSEQGHALQELTTLAINIGYDIEVLRKYNL
jgi:hypothetical protein